MVGDVEENDSNDDKCDEFGGDGSRIGTLKISTSLLLFSFRRCHKMHSMFG